MIKTAGLETYELIRTNASPDAQNAVYAPITLKVLPFEGQDSFIAYDITWMLNGSPIAGANNKSSYVTSKPGTYTALLQLKANPSTSCEAKAHLHAKPCKTYADIACGTLPSNITLPDVQAAGVSLAAGDEFTAGDYTIVVTEIISGDRNGGYTGTGYVKMKLVAGIVADKVAVDFSNLVVNTCYEMASGNLKTQYDPNWGNILDVDATICDIKNIISEAKILMLEITDEFALISCEPSQILKFRKRITDIETLRTKVQNACDLSATEKADLLNKIDALKGSCECLLNTTCPGAGARIANIATDCNFEANKKQLDEYFCQIVVNSFKIEATSSFTNITTSDPNLLAYFTPSGRLIYLPKRAKPGFGTSTSENLPVHPSALVRFELDGEQYVAHYSKFGENTDWTFNCFKSLTSGVGYKFENQPSSIKTNDNKLAYSVILGTTVSNTLPVGTLLSTLTATVESLELIIGQATARVLGFSISLSATAVCSIPFIVTSDQNQDYGAGALSPSLPAVRVLPIVIPENISIDIDHALPTGINGNCIVYVIWGPNFEHYKNPPHPIEVAKYGMTCQNKSDDRPEIQKRKFKLEHNVTTFDYAIIYSNLDAVTARLLEYSLIAHYTLYVKRGKLPPKHKLPSFKNDDPWDLIGSENERARRALKYIQEQIAKYGE